MKLFRYFAILAAASTFAAAHASWPQTFDFFGSPMGAYGRAMTIDAKGAIYIASEVPIDGQPYRIGLVKYNQNGVYQWSSTHSTGNSSFSLNDMAVDSTGCVYLAANYQVIANTSPFQSALMKFDKDGQYRWTRFRHTAANQFAYARDVAIAPDDTIAFLTMEDHPGNVEFATTKFAPNGSVLWSDVYSGNTIGDSADSLTVSGDGSIAVACTLGGRAYYDMGVVKYDSAGNRQWVAKVDGTQHFSDGAIAVVFDYSNNLVVTGQTINAQGTFDFLTAKLDANGNTLWQTKYGDAQGNEYAKYLGVDQDDNIVVNGWTSVTDHSSYLTVKYDTNGNKQWAKKFDAYGEGSNLDDVTRGMGVADDGTIYIGGYFRDPISHIYKMAAIKYSAAGQRSVNTYALTNGEDMFLTGVAFNRATNKLFVSGTTQPSSTSPYGVLYTIRR